MRLVLHIEQLNPISGELVREDANQSVAFTGRLGLLSALEHLTAYPADPYVPIKETERLESTQGSSRPLDSIPTKINAYLDAEAPAH